MVGTWSVLKQNTVPSLNLPKTSLEMSGLVKGKVKRKPPSTRKFKNVEMHNNSDAMPIVNNHDDIVTYFHFS